MVMLLPLWSIYRLLANRKKPLKIKYELLLFSFFSYLVAVATATIVPLSATTRESHSRHINLIPMYMTVYKYIKYQDPLYSPELHMLYLNFFGNILLFIPLGFLLPLLNKHNTKFKEVLLVSLSASVLIEVIQLIGLSLKIYRFIDVDDVLLNVFGAAVGYWMYKFFIRFTVAK